MKHSLWIIEDMVDLHTIYQNIFDEESYNISFFQSFDEFKNKYSRLKDDQLPDLIIADIMLEDGHFIKLLNDSEITLNTPYLVISSSDDIDTIRTAFEAGAIDYLLKPFNYNETLAKVERHINVIEVRNNEVSKSLEALNLNLDAYTNKEIKIIESFNANEDRSLHRNEIVNIIWKNVSIHPNTLDVHIYNLRKKLKKENYAIKATGNGMFKFMSLEIKPNENKND
jgi:DNA-binding response OmpR family regulator